MLCHVCNESLFSTLIAEVVNLPAASQFDWPGVYICIVKFPAACLGAH